MNRNSCSDTVLYLFLVIVTTFVRKEEIFFRYFLTFRVVFMQIFTRLILFNSNEKKSYIFFFFFFFSFLIYAIYILLQFKIFRLRAFFPFICWIEMMRLRRSERIAIAFENEKKHRNSSGLEDMLTVYFFSFGFILHRIVRCCCCC